MTMSIRQANTGFSIARSICISLLGFFLVGSAHAQALDTDGGAVGDGRADDTRALQSVLDSGQILTLLPGKSYRITAALRIKHSRTGIVGNGTSTIIMGADAGEFDNSLISSGTRYGENAVGVLATGIDQPILRNVRVKYERWIDDRYVKAVAFRNCTNILIEGNDIWGFSKSFGIVYIGGTRGGQVSHNHIHDSRTNSATNGQITGIEFDNDELVASSDVYVVGNIIKDLTVGSAFLKSFGNQTDGINTVRNKTARLRIFGNYIENVGDGIDHFGVDSVVAENVLRGCHNFCVKLIHGASRNIVERNAIRRAGLGGIVVSGSASAPADTADNTIRFNTIESVDPTGRWAANLTFGIGLTRNRGINCLPSRNRIHDNQVDLKKTGKVGVLVEAGTDNHVAGNTISNAILMDYKFLAPVTHEP
jgi:Pectate lyase superfamily protein